MSTQLRVFKADAGLKWLKAGWLIFKTQPMTFIFMHLFIGIVGLLSLFLPLLQVVAALATPFLTAGFYQAVLTKQQGGKIMLADILKPFSAKGNRLGLVRLALYQMGAGILMALLANGLFADAVAIMSQPGLEPQAALEQTIASISGASVILFFMAMLIYLTAFAYAVEAPGRRHLRRSEPQQGEAQRQSAHHPGAAHPSAGAESYCSMTHSSFSEASIQACIQSCSQTACI